MSEVPLATATSSETTQTTSAIVSNSNSNSNSVGIALSEGSTVPAQVTADVSTTPMAPPAFTSHMSTSTIDTHLLSPFPELPSDHEPTLMTTDVVTSAFTAATAAAISSAMASAQLTESTLVGTSDPGILSAFHAGAAPQQVMEIMHSYQQTNSHRRRSSVEAAAAASSVLASIASSSAKPYADSEGPQHSAAVALLAASGMHGVMLPTIPSESVSLRNTPGPADTFDSQFNIQSISTGQLQKPDSDVDDDESLSDDSKPIAMTNGMPLTPDAPGSGRPGSLRHLTPDERRARRLQRNRLAAKECRQKKKAYITNLEAQVGELQSENALLRKEIEELHAKLTLSGMRLNSCATSPTLDIRVADHPSDTVPVSASSLSSSSSSQPTTSLATAKRARIAESN
ncbi:hypothetical protein FB645_002385 [Coemansia sp. IMI 203386]|nr:hypothetical protein FB645_002385 [Coemansia sp. IMI 203386]